VAYTIQIPKDTKQAETTLSYIIKEGKAKRAPNAVSWWVARWYMRGVRTFQSLDYNSGNVQVSYMDEKGVLNFKYEDIVSKYQAQVGRLMQLNLSPVVTKEGISLDGMRKASIGQVVLDSVYPKPKLDKVQAETASNLLLYGTVALIPWWVDEDSIGIEVVPPWEILPIPVEVDSNKKCRGLIRRKIIPLEWVKNLATTPRGDAGVYKDMKTWEVPAGFIPAESRDRFQGSVVVGASDMTAATSMESLAGGSRKLTGTKRDKTRVKVTEAAEIWTMTEDNYWDEYILHVGDKIVYRTSYKGEKRQFPPQIITDVDIGNFWGKSFVDMLIPLNCEVEAALARQFQNVKDWDLFGVIYEPTTAGINTRATRGSDGLKRIKYEPDPIAPEHKPFNLRMSQTGLLPVKIVEMGAQVQTSIANQPSELMGGGAPGRVDSASGLGFLFETSNVPLTPTAKAISQAISSCYRVTLDITRKLWGQEKILDITHLDDSIAGILVDQQSGKIKLTDNSIPHPDEVIVNVASAIPRSKEQRKLEMKDSLMNGIITPIEYRIIARKEGLDLPVGGEVEWQNYRRATLENIILFGDGRIPGEVTYSDNDMHPVHLMKIDEFIAKPEFYVHLMKIDEFIAKPEFYLASPEVRIKFVEHRKEHLAGMGQVPDEMPYAEEAAEGAVGQIELEQQLLQGGGQPV
jgi:hypothetical protein